MEAETQKSDNGSRPQALPLGEFVEELNQEMKARCAPSSSSSSDFVPISEREQALLGEVRSALEETERAAWENRERYLRQEAVLRKQIETRRREAATLLDLVGRQYLKGREETEWDYSSERGGFVRVKPEEMK